MKRTLSAGLAILLGASCQTIADDFTPTHMLRLLCDGSAETGRQSRIAVLDVDDPVYDYGFATGHAIPSGRPCEVKDFSGNREAVNFIRFADNYQPGEMTDWAVIRFDKIATQRLVRYKLEPIEDLEPLEDKRFHFAQARGHQENTQTCKLSKLDFSNGRHRVTHDCSSIPGQSGSPVTLAVEDGDRLVGLHIGQLWMFNSPETNRPDRKGYINLLDQEIIDEIQSVISESRS